MSEKLKSVNNQEFSEIAEKTTTGNDSSECKKTSLQLAVLKHAQQNEAERELMACLLSGAQVNEQDALGNTAAHYAAVKGFVNILKILCKNEININLANHDGDTVLHFMIKAGKPDPECVQLLLFLDIDRLIKNRDGYTAEQLIKSNIADVELCAKMYTIFYNIHLQSKQLPKSNVTSVRYEKLKRRYSSIELRNPNQYVNESLDEVVQEACKTRSSTNRLTVIECFDRSSQPVDTFNISKSLITISDIESSNLKKIRYYLQCKGNPNLSIDPNNQSLIVHAINRRNLYLVLELLRYGAKLNINDFKESEKNKEMLLTVTKELALDVRLIKALVDNNIERESRTLHGVILGELLNETNDQETQLLNQGRITPRDNRDLKCKNTVIDICNIPILSEVKYNQNSYTSTLGLLSLYSPIEILYSLLELLPEFTISQKLSSVILMKFVFLHAWKFGHELPSQNHMLPYYHYLQNAGISKKLNNIYIYMYEFAANSTLKGYLTLNNITSKYPNAGMGKIEKIIENAISDKKANLNEVSAYIANEFVILTARYYHQCGLIDVNHLEKMDYFSIEHEYYLVTALKAFIQKTILSQDTLKKCEKAIRLFINIAKICLTNKIITDLNSVAIIIEAISSKWITRLRISLDKKTLSLYNDLKDMVSKMNNFKIHREFQKIYKYCLPWIEVIRKDLDSIANTYQLSQVQLLGDAFEPLVALKDRLDLYLLKSNSDLNNILKYINIPEKMLITLSVALRPPDIPKLSYKCAIYDFKNAIHDQRLTQSPLTIKYNDEIRTGDAALTQIKKWLDEMKSKLIITGEENAQIYFGCQAYHAQFNIVPTNKPCKNTADLTSSESHKFFSGFTQKSRSGASGKYYARDKLSDTSQPGYSKRGDN